MLRVIPADTPQTLFEEVDVEVWHRPTDGGWRWRVLVDGIDDNAVTRSLRALEDEGGDVLPSVPARLDDAVAEADQSLSELFSSAVPAQEQARFEAIASGGEVTFLVPAFPLALADLALLLRLEEEQGRSIRVVVALTADLPGGRRNPDPLHELFARLRRSGASTSECQDRSGTGCCCAAPMRSSPATVSTPSLRAPAVACPVSRLALWGATR